MGQTSPLGVLCGSVYLVVVVVQSCDIGIGKSGNLSGRPANTTSNVKDFHPCFETHHMGQVVLVAGNCLMEWLAIIEATEILYISVSFCLLLR